MKKDWQPAASFETLKHRAALLSSIRAFMAERGILEVETPILSRAGNTDPNLHSFSTTFHSPSSLQPLTYYLHTSPEFAMKRLLAAGSGPIYQICRVFRDEEAGRLHEPEFTMLEWYRPGFDPHALMDEMSDLLGVLGLAVPLRITYAEVFQSATGLDPHTASDAALQQCAASAGLLGEHHPRTLLLDFLFSARVMPGLGTERPLFVLDFPACQAALARIRPGPPAVAERFELFINGVELANGFHELTDAAEQRARFEADNHLRRERRQPELPVDEQLLAALQQGLPACAGVAVGIDRLLMQIMGYDSIEQVVTFTCNQA